MSKIYFINPFEIVPVNVYDKHTKEIVYTGSQLNAALFIKTSKQNIVHALKRKTCIKKQYVVRYAKN